MPLQHDQQSPAVIWDCWRSSHKMLWWRYQLLVLKMNRRVGEWCHHAQALWCSACESQCVWFSASELDLYRFKWYFGSCLTSWLALLQAWTHNLKWTSCLCYHLLWWQIFGLHHACFHLLQWSVLPLCNTILVWCVGDRMLHLNTCICTIVNKLSLDILTTIFRPEYLEFSSTLVFNQSLEDFE